MMEGKTSSNGLPPGFRFHPTDEELIIYYLKNQAMSMPCPVSIIPEVDIYKFDPWQLPEKAEFGENEWYFFTPRDRKYPNGVRPNRATLSGYWKATGTDKAISSGSKYVGVKKALVFYKGRPPKGMKTDWIMHEYRLTDFKGPTIKRSNGSMRLDDWVLCRIYKKKHAKTFDQNTEYSNAQTVETSDGGHVDDQEILKFPRTGSLTHLLEMDYLSPVSHILADHPYNNVGFDFPNTIGSSDSASSRLQLGGEFQSNYAEWSKPPLNNNNTNNNNGLNQTHPFINSIFDLQ